MGRIAGGSAEDTRDRLIAAAAGVFAERGYERATISEITSRAALSSGAVYANYGSKSELLVAAIRANASEEIDALVNAKDADAIREQLLKLGSALPRRRTIDGALLVEAVVAARRDPDVAAVLSKLVRQREERFAQLIHRAFSEGPGGDGPQETTDEVDDGPVAPEDEAIARFAMMLTLGSLLAGSLDLPAIDSEAWDDVVGRVISSVADADPAAPQSQNTSTPQRSSSRHQPKQRTKQDHS